MTPTFEEDAYALVPDAVGARRLPGACRGLARPMAAAGPAALPAGLRWAASRLPASRVS